MTCPAITKACAGVTGRVGSLRHMDPRITSARLEDVLMSSLSISNYF